MQAFICLFFPPILMLLFWKRLNREQAISKRDLAYYTVAVLLLNFLCMGVIVYATNNMSVVYRLNTYSDFALKYLVLAGCLSFAVPVAIYFCRRKLTVSVTTPKWSEKFPRWKVIGIIYCIILFAMHARRVTDNNFWGDECFSILLSRMSFQDMINATAADVHPPLYYFILQMVCSVVGNNNIAFNITSLLPYAITLCFAMTAVWKKWGKEAAFILITFASLLSCAIQYNTEIRMYSWAALFVLLSFYCLYNILTSGKVIHYVLFAFASLGAAYSHYYSLISVAFFYVVLLIVTAFKWKKYWFKVLCTCVGTVVGYLPWFFILLKTFEKKSESFWIAEIPTMKESVYSLFNGKYPKELSIAFFVIVTLVVLKELKIFTIEKAEDKRFCVNIQLAKIDLTVNAVWLFAGLLCTLGTAAAGIAVSKIYRPLYLVRYLYPVAPVAWLMFGICVSKLKGKKILCLVLVLLMLTSGIPLCNEAYKVEQANNATLSATLAATADLDGDDYIFTNSTHIAWTIGEYYYPEATIGPMDWETFPELDPNTTYWFIINFQMTETPWAGRVLSQQFALEEVTTVGNLGLQDVFIYKAYKQK